MRLIVLLLTSLCYDTPAVSFAFAKAEVPPRSNRVTPKRFARATKRQDDLGYLEQCSILQFWDKQIGRVNVLAFFDSTWPFSHRQAAMLRVLRERFDKTGFENIQFLAINAAPGESEYVSRAEIEVEEETWKQISPSEADGVPSIVPSAEALAAALGPEVYFIQDTAELEIWPKLRAFRDQILVIDRCGRLTYQVIVPWSILHFPYVKAAILSTYKDEPCGACEFRQLFDYSTERNDEGSTAPTSSSQTEENDDARTISSERYVESTTIGVAPTEGGNDRSELLFSRTDDYDEQTVTPRLTPPIDANDDDTTIPSPTTADNATSIEPSDDISTEMIDTDFDDAETITMPDDFELSTYPGQTNDDDQLARMTDQSVTMTEQPDDDYNSTRVEDYDTTTFQSTDYDYSNVTDNRYEEIDRSNFTMNLDNMGDVENDDESRIIATNNETRNDSVTNSSEIVNGERRLITDTKDIESLDARDVLKSRSPNARSVSPNDATDNQLQVIEVKSEAAVTSEETTKEEGQIEADYLIPIRIIMRAPHVDEYSDRSLKAHEYLVLKTGQPSYHEHLESTHQHEHHDKPVRKKAEAVKSTFARDESPGLYGELADYWQNYGNEHGHDDASDSSSLEDDHREHVLEQEQIFTDGSATAKPSTLVNDHAKALESDNEQHYDDHSTSYEDSDVIDEEAKSKLIAHYSKLLPWLYYVLAK